MFVLGFVLFAAPMLGVSMMADLCSGAVFGLVLGGFHNFYNKALLCGWSWETVMRDTAYCAAMGAALSFLTMHLRTFLGA